MRKIILLLIFIFLISGCYDYVELTDLSMITTITIDKIDNNYLIAFEILNNEKKDTKSFTVKGEGSTIPLAINNTFRSTPKQPYLAHLKALIISEEVGKNDLKEIIEYFLRSPNIRSEFFLLISKNNQAQDIFKARNDSLPIISSYLEKTINQNINSSNNLNVKNFENILIDIFEKGKDTTIPVIRTSNDKIIMDGNALMNDFKLVSLIDYNDSLILNLLDGKVNNITYSLKCPDSNKELSLTIFESKTNYIIKKNKLYINVNLNAEIDKYDCDKNLKEASTINELNNHYSKDFEKKINMFYKLIKNNKTDVLGIGKLIYNKKRYYKEDDWLRINHKINVNFKINKEGLIFEVKNGN